MMSAERAPQFPAAAMAAVLLAVSTASAGYGIVLPVLPLMLQTIDGPGATADVSRHTGLLTGLHTFALFLFAPIWGQLSDRYGRRIVLCICLLGFGASLLISSVKLSIGSLYAERFLTGIFAAGIAPVASAIIADQGGSEEWKARRIAWISMAAISGFLMGPMLSGFLTTLSMAISGVGPGAYELPFFTIASIAFVASLAVLRSLPDRDHAAVTRVQLDTPASKASTRAVVYLRAIAFLVAGAVGLFEVGLAVRGTQDLGMAPAQIALMFAACSLVMFVVQAIVFLPRVNPSWTRWLIAPALGILAGSLAIVPGATGFGPLLATVTVVAASAGVVTPVLTYWTSLEASPSKGADLGKQAAVVSLGQALGSIAGGVFYASMPTAPFVLIALLLLGAAAAALGLPQRLRHGVHPDTVIRPGEGSCATALAPTPRH